MYRYLSFIAPLLTFLVLLIFWEFLVNYNKVPLYILPAPSDIFLSLIVDQLSLDLFSSCLYNPKNYTFCVQHCILVSDIVGNTIFAIKAY